MSGGVVWSDRYRMSTDWLSSDEEARVKAIDGEWVVEKATTQLAIAAEQKNAMQASFDAFTATNGTILTHYITYRHIYLALYRM